MLATTIQITNNPPHTTHTQKKTPQAGCAGNHHQQGGGRSHGVEREPDSVLARYNIFMPNPKHAPTPTTHCRAVNTCRHKKTTQHTNQTANMLPCSPQNKDQEPTIPHALP